MKKIAIIFTVIFVVLLIAFPISVAATGGVKVENGFNLDFSGLVTGMSIGSGIHEYDFDVSEINDLEISTASAETVIKQSDSDKIEVKYTANKTMGVSFNAAVVGEKLIVEEKLVTLGISLGINNNNKLEISLPEKVYKNVVINQVSGNVTADEITAEYITLSTVSGNTEADLYADTISIEAVSGNITLNNPTEKKIENLNISAVSGVITLDGYASESTELDLTSGEIYLNGISGEVDVNTTSGDVYLDYSEWNDKLTLNMMSGDVNVTLPEGSGVKVNQSSVSGDVSIDLDGEKMESDGNSNYTVGGENVHTVEINGMSGDVEIKN